MKDGIHGQLCESFYKDIDNKKLLRSFKEYANVRHNTPVSIGQVKDYLKSVKKTKYVCYNFLYYGDILSIKCV